MKNLYRITQLYFFFLILLPAFLNAQVVMDKSGKSPASIQFKDGNQPTVASFFEDYRKDYSLSDDNQMEAFRSSTDKTGSHHRYYQYYKGIEIIGAQYILHEKNDAVWYANGQLIHDLDLDVTPILSEEEALSKALLEINAKVYMWDNEGNESSIKKNQGKKNGTYYPHGELKLSAGTKELSPENIRLVYRFDIFAQEPLSRDWVDVDAKTGEIIGKISRIQNGDVPGSGQSLFNGAVNMTISDSDYPSPGAQEPHFHLDTWSAYGGSGESWRVSVPDVGNNGGYEDRWYDGLDTDPILLSGSDHQLTFFHRYFVESPAGAGSPYDAWDGLNIRISTDGGTTYQVLPNPSPAYSNSSLFSFGSTHGEGPNIPGWTGELSTWTQVTIDLAAYAGQSVNIRFAFASDEAASSVGNPQFFGWQIDDIVVSGSGGTLFSNAGEIAGMTPVSLARGNEAVIIPGNYRLREAARSKIFTFDMNNSTDYSTATDFVNDDNNFISAESQVGVSVHWATEATYDYYLNVHDRDSYDDAGADLISYVSYDNAYNNAFWNGSFMTYGDGNGTTWYPLVSLDVVGHELTHGVTEHSSNLIYSGESGGLNESFSDIFGNLVEFYMEGNPGVGTGSWRIGEDILVNGLGIRNMADPNEFGNPDTYLGNYWYDEVHNTSGVQNYWFYLLAEGGSGVNDNGDPYNVTAIGIDDAAAIAYMNNNSFLIPSSNYQAARDGSIVSARALFGDGSQQAISTAEAWDAVGVYANCPAPTGLLAQNIQANSAELSWTESGIAIEWEIKLLESGDDPTGVTPVSSTNNPYLATDLQRNTTYDFYVRASCGSPTFSDWAGPVSFYTYGCYSPLDTLDTQWLTPEPTVTIYENGAGWISGIPDPLNSLLATDAKGIFERYVSPEPGVASVGAVRVGLGYLHDDNDNTRFDVVVYDDNGTGSPGTLVGSLTDQSPTQLGVPGAGSYADFWFELPTAPIPSTSNFHVGVIIYPGDVNDTLLVTTSCAGLPDCAVAQGESDASNTIWTSGSDYESLLNDYALDFDVNIIPVIGNTDIASITYSSSIYCPDGSDPTPTITGVPGGTFTSVPDGLIIDSNNGTIDLSASASGIYTVTYTTPGDCSIAYDVNVEIDAVEINPICQNIDLYLDDAGLASITVADIDGGSSNNCGAVTLSASQTTFNMANLGANDVTLTVTDALGNSESCVAVVTVIDTVTRPLNDLCINAIPLTTGSTTPGTTYKASFDEDAPACDFAHTTGGVWYTVVGDGFFTTASLCGGPVYDSRMTVYEGDCNALICITADDDYCGSGSTSETSWLTIPGTTYYILIHGSGSAFGDFTIEVEATATVDAGSDETICHTGTYTLSGSTATGYSSLSWAGGDGSFNDPTILAPTYTPGATDISNGSVTLTLTANPMAPATNTPQSSMTLDIIAITLTCPSNVTENGCQDQAAIDAAFTSWLATATTTSNGIEAECELSGSTLDDALGGDIWNRPIGVGPSISGLGPVSYYKNGPITFDISGSYTFNSVQNAWDGYIHVYENSFDPLDQLTNLIAANDDGAGGIGTSDIEGLSITAGTEYYLITSGFAAGDYGSFEITVTGPGTYSCSDAAFASNDNTGAPLATGGSTTVTWTIIDWCGDPMTCSATFTVENYIGPIMSISKDEFTFFVPVDGNASDQLSISNFGNDCDTDLSWNFTRSEDAPLNPFINPKNRSSNMGIPGVTAIPEYQYAISTETIQHLKSEGVFTKYPVYEQLLGLQNISYASKVELYTDLVDAVGEEYISAIPAIMQYATTTVQGLPNNSASGNITANEAYSASTTHGSPAIQLDPDFQTNVTLTGNMLYNNGPLVNSHGTGAGGADESVLQSSSLGMGILGFGHQYQSNLFVADEFEVTSTSWQVETIDFFAYQTGSPTTSTISGVYYQILDGPPNDPNTNIVFGDLSTNSLINTAWSNIYRVDETSSGSSERPIMVNTVSANVSLPQGTYWIVWTTDGSGSYSGPWAPPITINGQTTTGNAMQYTGSWVPVEDIGPQGLPFIIYGEDNNYCPWLSISPNSGTTASQSEDLVNFSVDATGLAPGIYQCELSLVNNSSNKPQTTIPITMHVVSCLPPSDQLVENLAIGSANLSWTENGSANAWQIRLDVAGFDTTGVVPVNTTANPQGVSGFIPGTEYDFYLRSDCGDGDYSAWVGPYSFYTFGTELQTVTNYPGWALISSYLVPNEPTLDVINQSLVPANNLIIMASGNGIYWPEYNTNTIGEWNVYEGYKTKFNTTGEFVIQGRQLSSTIKSFGAGFHIIPVLTNQNANIMDIFDDPMNDILVLYDLVSSQVFWPAGGITNNLTELIPGRGYQAFFNNEVTINFPEYSPAKSAIMSLGPIAQAKGPWDITPTGNVHLISIDRDATAGIKNGSFIGAFDGSGQCIGFVKLGQTNENTLLTVYGNDETTAIKDGAAEEEYITFRTYDEVTDLETTLEATYNQCFPNHDGLFSSTGLSGIVNFKTGATGLGEGSLDSQISVYPNPAKEEVNIEVQNVELVQSIAILSTNGVELRRLSQTGNKSRIDISDMQKGVYFIKINFSGSTVVRRIVIL